MRPLAALLLSCLGLVAAERRPNFLLILADDLGREVLASYGGGSGHPTPSIDRLVAEGLRFETCYANPLCSPSRLQLLTGRHGFRNYVQWGSYPAGAESFVARLRDAGYATALAGKWQMGGWHESPLAIARAGFGEWFAHLEFEESGETGPRPGNRYWGGPVMRGDRRERLDRHGPEAEVDFLVDFMRRNRGRPFLAYYPMHLLHRPFQATPGDPRAPAPGTPPPSDWLSRHGRAEHFPAMVRAADRAVGRLLAALDELGLARDTLVILTSDNGTDNVIEAAGVRHRFLGREVRGGKYLPTELGLNVPLVARWPGRVRAGAVTSELADFTDLFPTLAGLAGADRPSDAALDGRSLAPLLLGQPGASGKPFVVGWGNFEGNSSAYKRPADNPGRLLFVVRDNRWKLRSDGALFDLRDDFLEARPLSPGASPEADAARARLAEHLRLLRSSQPRLW